MNTIKVINLDTLSHMKSTASQFKVEIRPPNDLAFFPTPSEEIRIKKLIKQGVTIVRVPSSAKPKSSNAMRRFKTDDGEGKDHRWTTNFNIREFKLSSQSQKSL